MKVLVPPTYPNVIKEIYTNTVIHIKLYNGVKKFN